MGHEVGDCSFVSLLGLFDLVFILFFKLEDFLVMGHEIVLKRKNVLTVARQRVDSCIQHVMAYL